MNGVLPLRLFHNDASGQTTIDIVSGTLTLNADATFREVLQYHIVPPAPQAPSDSPVTTDGTFTLDGESITFTFIRPSGQPYSWGGIVKIGNVTYTDPSFTDAPTGVTAVYVK